MSFFVDNILRYAGGLGLCFGGLGIGTYLAMTCTSQVMSGIANNSFRLTKVVNMEFLGGDNNALEISTGANGTVYATKGFSFFSSLYLSIILLGYYCQHFEISAISLFDRNFVYAFLIGGGYIYLVCVILNNIVYENNEFMASKLEESN